MYRARRCVGMVRARQGLVPFPPPLLVVFLLLFNGYIVAAPVLLKPWVGLLVVVQDVLFQKYPRAQQRGWRTDQLRKVNSSVCSGTTEPDA